VLLIVASAVASGPAAPARAAQPGEPHHRLESTFRAYTDSAAPDSAEHWPSSSMPVGGWTDEGGGKHISRSYLAFDIAGLNGPRLEKAVLIGSGLGDGCWAERTLTVQATQEFSGHTWARPPGRVGAAVTESTPAEEDRCRRASTVDVTTMLARALKRSEPKLWMELRIPKQQETDPAHSRWFTPDEFRLDVTLANSAPLKPTKRAVDDNGTPCSDDQIVSRNFSGHVNMIDRDRNPADELTAEFQYWSTAEPQVKRTAVAWSNRGDLPVERLNDGRYGWHARVFDGRAHSPWSDPCYFTVDRTAPAAAPTAASPEYPENSPVPTGQFNRPATFLFTANGTADVVAFRYGTDDRSISRVTADEPGGAATVQMTFPGPGPQKLYVRSIDRAGNESPVRVYAVNARTFQVDATTTTAPDPSGAFGMAVTFRFATQPGNGIKTVSVRVDDSAEQAGEFSADGIATVTVTPVQLGQREYTFSARDAAGTERFRGTSPYLWIWDFPVVTSDGVYPVNGTGGGVGVPGSFTVKPNFPAHAESVRWRGEGGEQAVVPVNADGTARVTWTPAKSGRQSLWFTVRYKDGTESATQSITTAVAS
jgi:hypothetical protein